MTIALRLNGVTLPAGAYPHIVDFTGPDLPVKTGLVALHQFGGTLSDSLNNLVTGADATAVGAPTINEFGAVLAPASCIELGVSSAAEVTLMILCKPVLFSETGVNCAALTNYYADGEVTEGDNLFFWNASGDNLVRQWADFTGGAGPGAASSGVINAVPSTDYAFFCGKAYDSTKAKAFFGHGGVLTAAAEGTNATARSFDTTRNFRVGGHYAAGGFNTPLTAALVAVFHAELTDSQITANYEYLRDVWAPAFGVTTL